VLTSSSTTTTSAPDNNVASTGGTALLPNSGPTTDGQWTLFWTYDCVLLCTDTSLNQHAFESDLGETYKNFKADVQAATNHLTDTVAGKRPSLLADMQSALTGAFAADGKTLYGSSATVPAPTSGGKVAYYVTFSPSTDPVGATAAGCTTGTPSTATKDTTLTAPKPADGDPLFGQPAYGTSTSQTDCLQKVVKATVWRETSSCSGFPSVCTWGSGTRQFDLTATRNETTTSTKAAGPASASFPLTQDITRHQTVQDGPGDVYIEGNVTGKLSVVAEHDAVVTGNFTYNAPGTDAADIVAANNVRLYHPVACADASTTGTTAGWCPNDTTGLAPKGKLRYNTTNFDQHPSRQYVNIRRTAADSGAAQVGTDLANLNIAAGLFALTGSVVADNYDRGAAYDPDGTLHAGGLNTLTVTGSICQLHHGPVGVQWEIASNASARPTSGYPLNITYDKTLIDRGLPYTPSPAGTNAASTWRIVSTSTAGDS
jgi:hypothetical protein